MTFYKHVYESEGFHIQVGKEYYFVHTGLIINLEVFVNARTLDNHRD